MMVAFEPFNPIILHYSGAAMQKQPLPDLQTQDCMALACHFRPCFGPRGLPKPRLFRFIHGLSHPPTHSLDTASVLAHMSVDDPYARVLASAASKQVEEVGDGAVLVLLLGSSLLEQAQRLLALGIKEEEIQQGYRQAMHTALELMESNMLACAMLKEPHNEQEVAVALRDFFFTREPRLSPSVLEAVAQCCVLSLRNGENGLTFDPSCTEIKTVTGECPSTKGTEGCEGSDKEEKEGEVSITERRDEDKAIDRHNEKEDDDKENKNEDRAINEGAEELRENREEPVKLEERKTKEAPTKREQQPDQVGLSDCMRADGKIEVEDKVMNERRERENGWEEWAALEREMDELRSGGEGEEEKVHRKRDDRKEKMKGGGKEMGVDRQRKVRMWGTREVRPRRINQFILRVGKSFSVTRNILVRKDGRKRKLYRLKERQARCVDIHSLTQTKKQNCNPKLSNRSKTVQAVVSNKIYDTNNKSTKVLITIYSLDPDLLESAERAIRSSLKLYHSLLSEPRLLPGAGLAEVALAGHLTRYGLSIPGLEQLAVHAFAQALLEPVRALAQNSGRPGDLLVLSRYKEQFWNAAAEGKKRCRRVLDPVVCKKNAVKRATEAALCIITQQLSQNPEKSRHQHAETVQT